MSFFGYELPFDLSSISLKTSFIILVVSYTIIMAGFLVYNSLKIAAPITSYGNMATMNTPETGSHTYCETNSECWCRNFDGAKFNEGKVPGLCDSAIKRCGDCHYR